MMLWLWLLAQSRSQKLQRGQGLVEYAMIIILIGIAAIVVMALLGPTIGNMYQNIIDEISGL